MHNLILRIIVVLWLAALVTACQMGSQGLGQTLDRTVDKLIKTGSDALKFMNTFAIIQRDFKHGRIMRARERVLAMPLGHQDHAKSHAFLKQTIEPARRRVFVHYLRSAKKHADQQHWSAAMWAYDQAKAVTIKPDRMEKKRTEMERKMRQLRFDKVLQQRRKEDARLLNDARAYAAPKGVNPNDDVYGRLREHYNDALTDRARLAFREARRFLRKDLPEIAYVEIESYMRLQPGTMQGKKTLAEIRQKVPATLLISALPKSGTKQIVAAPRITMPKKVTGKMVVTAMQSGNLIKAQQLAQLYRRHAGNDERQAAEKLWTQVQAKMDSRAALLFTKGSDAFAKEKLAQAIVYWRDAVALQPDKSEYQEALQRARQLQEHLSLLRDKRINHQPIGLMPEEK